MKPDNSIRIVLAWQDAANRQDAEAVIALSAPDVEIVGPRGTVRGRDILRSWLERAGLTLTTQRLFARDEAVVIAQHGVWAAGGEADVATYFRATDGLIVHIARYDTLADALSAAALSEADEVAQPNG